MFITTTGRNPQQMGDSLCLMAFVQVDGFTFFSYVFNNGLHARHYRLTAVSPLYISIYILKRKCKSTNHDRTHVIQFFLFLEHIP